ncbi:retrovirus-related pol polyprotein from transposon TNT 1-94 [Tanacetum coccineum]
MKLLHVTFDEMHQSMAPARMSSGPEPFIMTPGQLKSGLAPTDKELEMLFQPMFDEHLEQSRVNEPVPSATEFNAQVVPPGSAQSSSGNVNSAEPIQVNYPPDHLRRWTKDHPLDNIVGNPSRPVSTRKQLASDALWCCFHTELSKVEPKNFKMAVIEDCWFQAMQDEIHEFDRLEVWELVPRPIYVMVIALKWIYKVKLDEYFDVLEKKSSLSLQREYPSGGRIMMERNSSTKLCLNTMKVWAYFIKSLFRELLNKMALSKDEIVQTISSRAWYDTLSKFLLANNFFKGAVDPTLFTRKSGKHILLVQIYVDDIIFASTDHNACNTFSKEMSSKFQMSMMGQMSFFLGLWYVLNHTYLLPLKTS